MSYRTIAFQAGFLSLNLLVMAVLSSPSTARWIGTSIAVVAALVLMLSLLWTDRTYRRGLMQAMVWPIVIFAVPWLVGELRAADLLNWRVGIAPKDLNAVLTIVIGSTTAFAAIFLSSLVDAVYIRPTISGRGRNAKMPCQSSLDERWKGLTARWFMHRLLSTLGFILGLTIVVTITVKHWIVPHENQTTAAGIAAAATLLAGFYLTRARSVIAFASNPALHVGDVVELIDEGTQHVRRYYVQDVSLEGIKLLELEDNMDRTPKEQDSTWPSHDRMLDLPDVLRLLRARKRFTPCGDCASKCKHVNPHCRFKPKRPAEKQTAAPDDVAEKASG